MLVMSQGALSAAQAETYYEEKYSQDDYYTFNVIRLAATQMA